MAVAGDLELERVYAEHGHVVLRRARRILGDEEEAREALQEIFVSLIDHPDQFAGHSSITTFLYRVTTNLCLNKLRDHRRRANKLLEHGAAQADRQSGPVAEASVEAQELLMRLPEKLARVAVHYYIDEMTHEEIADMLGCSRRMVGKLVAQVQRELGA
ncbi:RNA polymerase sigma factor [Sorangium sp. So ce1128]